MKILLLEPYFTGSHAAWAKSYVQYSQHQVEILSLPGRFWKWRMHGGAITLARQFLESASQPDLILTTDMLDFSTFLALTRARTAHIPTAVYFHENQLTYPWSPSDRDIKAKRDQHYGFINYLSALTADAVFFNSPYHRKAFLEALPKFLKQYPDHKELETLPLIEQKAQVLPLGLDLKKFDPQRSDTIDKDLRSSARPLILWNHRWEYDKNPSDFFAALYALADQGLRFEVALLGENFRRQPVEFTQAQERLGERIVQAGYADSFAAYARWLWRADILPVTSYHDFFGASTVEAIYCGCYPLLPNRLVYPNLIPPNDQADHLYSDLPELIAKLAHLLTQVPPLSSVERQAWVKRYDWSIIGPRYDQVLQGLV